MSKKIIYCTIVGILVVLFFMSEIYGPKKHNWSMSFTRYSREPYGNFLLYDFLKILFPGKNIRSSLESPYTVLKGKKTAQYNYIFINNTCVFDDAEGKELLNFAAMGNNVFIAAHSLSNIKKSFLAEKLGLETSRVMELIQNINVKFVNDPLKVNYNLKEDTGVYYFSKYDNKRTHVISVNDRGNPVYIKVKYGRGYFFLSSVPLAFTNYSIVSKNSNYPFMALSYLPKWDTVWDEFYKIGRIESGSPLRFILKREPLRWAYIMVLSIVILVIISGAKRKQRIIPVKPPVINTTLDFVTTVGSLYYRNKDHRDLARKKILYFFEFIRSHLYMDTRIINDDFYARLASASGSTPDEMRENFSFIDDISRKEAVSEKELIELNKRIDELYFRIRRG